MAFGEMPRYHLKKISKPLVYQNSSNNIPNNRPMTSNIYKKQVRLRGSVATKPCKMSMDALQPIQKKPIIASSDPYGAGTAQFFYMA
jgi:hypothetical protein